MATPEKEIEQKSTKSFWTRFYFSFIWLGVLIFAADLISKWAVQNSLKVGQVVPLIPNFLNVTLAHNLGAAFSLGANGELGWRIFWMIVSITLSTVLIIFYKKRYKILRTWVKVGLMMIITGALGNMIDRCFYWKAIVGFDGVIDWIDFQFGTAHFATFNLADSSLVIGVIMLIVVVIIDAIKEAKEKKRRGEYDLKPQDYKKLQEEKRKNEENSRSDIKE